MDKIEVLVDAIAHLNGSAVPDSDCYKLRNPLLIRSFARPGKNPVDDKGRRVFTTWQAGYKASCYDMSIKVRGQSRAGLKDTDTLSDLLGAYNLKEKLAVDRVANFAKKALQDPSITANTPLSFFITPESSQELE